MHHSENKGIIYNRNVLMYITRETQLIQLPHLTRSSEPVNHPSQYPIINLIDLGSPAPLPRIVVHV